jgi:tRNA threonylcarbamoyl adenosine modification protein YeaZ
MYVNLNGTSIIVENNETHYHSAYLISTIKNILKNNNLSPEDIDIIATNIGPGSFTGIRACVTVARVFAQAKKINICAVSSLEILAQSAKSYKVLTALDARKDSAYVAGFEFGKCILEPCVMKIEDLKNILPQYSEAITDDYLSSILNTKSYSTMNVDLGKNLYKISLNKNPIKWSMLEPLYLQPPPVTLKK